MCHLSGLSVPPCKMGFSLVPRLFVWAAHRKEEPGTNCTRMRVINGFTHVYFQMYDVFTNGLVLT